MDTENMTDNQAPVETEVNQEAAPQETSTEQEGQAQETYIPFKNGKEKFVIQGQEVEADWDTVKREYQLASVSRRKMEEAASIRKKADEALKQLYRAAHDDPEGLIRLFNPKYGNMAQGTARAVNQETDDPASQGQRFVDPEIAELREKVSSFEKHFEQLEVQKEREAIAQEYTKVVERFPALKGKAEKALLYSEYRRALESGLEDLSLEDVAFYVNKEIEQERNQARQTEIQKQQENKRKAPVSARPAAASEKQGFESIDDVKRLIGRIS